MWPRVRRDGGLWRGGATAAAVATVCGRRWPIVVRGWVGGFRPELGGREATNNSAGRPACLPAAGLRGVLGDGVPSRRRGFVCNSLGLGKGVSLDAQSAADEREGEEAAAEAGHFDSSVSSRHVLQRRLVPGSPAAWCTGTGPAQAPATPLMPEPDPLMGQVSLAAKLAGF